MRLIMLEMPRPGFFVALRMTYIHTHVTLSKTKGLGQGTETRSFICDLISKARPIKASPSFEKLRTNG